jgi:lycopene cyclase domain-containing protein
LVTVVIAVLMIRTARQLRACLFATALSILIGYPWNAFAISAGVWASRAPGPRLFAVPVNDVVFLALCTLVSCTILSWESPAHRGNTGERGSK